MKRAQTFLRTVALGVVLPWWSWAASVTSPEPEVSLSLRGVANRTIQVGEPLFVAVRIEAASESERHLELAPASGPWTDAVEVEIAGVGNGGTMMRARLTVPADSAVASLSEGQSIGAVWMIASSSTSQLAPGDYHVQARLIVREGRGWTGEAVSEAIPLRVVVATSARDRAIQFALARAHEAALAGSLPEAAGLIDALLAADPDDIHLLTTRAALCVKGGDYPSAQACVNRAIALCEGEGGKYPPVGLFELEARISSALIQSGPTQAGPPAWTRPPANVLDASPAKRSPQKVPAEPAVIPARAAPAPVVAVALPTSSVESTKRPAAKIDGAGNHLVVPSGELVDAKIRADVGGQWAVSARAGSEYGKTQYSAAKATGPPDVPIVGNSPDAWCPASKDKGTDWLEVTFAKPVQAIEVRVRQSDAAGAIAKVEAIESDGTAHVWWEGVDPYQPPPVRDVAWFAVRVPKTSYSVARVKLTLNLASGPGYKQIDAVQLVSSAP